MYSHRADLGQRSETVRRANLSAIVRALHEDGPQSRSALVARTGLTRSAIRALVGELTASGLATEDRAIHLGTPGRPSPEVSLVPESATAVAFAIGVDSLAAAVVGLGGNVLAEERVERPRGHHSVHDIVSDIVGIFDMLPGGRSSPDRIVGVGVAVAGIVRRADGLVEAAPNLGWTSEPLGSVLAERLGWDIPVLVGNEADLGVIAELRRGAARGLDDVIYVHGEVGVGAGIITGGRPLIGAAGYAGELGHFPVSADGRPCRCGSHGCWETEVGGEALLVRAGYPSDARQEGIDAVLRDAAAGSPVALAAIELTGERLGVGLAGFVNAFNPRLIVLGGLFGRLQPFAQAAIWTAMAARTLPAPLAMVRVVPASLGNDAPLLGAAEMALEVVLRDPATRLGSRDGVAELVTA